MFKIYFFLPKERASDYLKNSWESESYAQEECREPHLKEEEEKTTTTMGNISEKFAKKAIKKNASGR